MSLYKWPSQPTQSITQAVQDAKPTAPKQDKQMTHAHCKPVFLPWSHKHDSLAKGADAQFQSRELRASSLLGSIPLCVLGHSPDFARTRLPKPLSGLSLSPGFVLSKETCAGINSPTLRQLRATLLTAK